MKRFLCFVLAFIMLALTVSTTALCDSPSSDTVSQESVIKLTINGRKTDTYAKYGVAVSVNDDVITLPLRAIADSYGMVLEADVSGKSAVCTYEDLTVAFEADSNVIVRDGDEITVSTPVTVQNGEFVVTDEVLLSAFDLMVNYKSEKALVTIIKKDPVREAEIAEKQAASEKKGKDKGSKTQEIITVISAMNVGFLATLKLFAITLIGALPLGLIIALCSMSKFLPLKLLTRLLVWIIRGTPLMLQLLIIFYIPGMVMANGSPWPRGEEGRFMAASVAFIINYAFYFSEIFRGGIENVPKGQVEAGQVLGMTKTQIFFNVTLLQMIKRIVPPMSNEIITLVKDTSIARIISMQEVIWAGYAFLKSSHGYSGLLWPLFFTGVYYLLFNGILTVLFGKIEKKLSYFN